MCEISSSRFELRVSLYKLCDVRQAKSSKSLSYIVCEMGMVLPACSSHRIIKIT